MAKIVNLTPHMVTLYKGKAAIATFPSQGLARARQADEHVTDLMIEGYDVPLVRSVYGEVTGLPAPHGETMYIVSLATAMAARSGGRTTNDLLLTSDLVRDGEGAIIGCRRFAIL
jgi:hypothetical protein